VLSRPNRLHPEVNVDIENRKLSRGSLLQKLAAAPIAIGAFAALQAEAQAAAVKPGHVPQTAVQYQATPKNGQQCSQCRFFINNAKSKSASGWCTQVAGSISPKGWCVAYSKGDNSKQKM
jgi:hypothetical protein